MGLMTVHNRKDNSEITVYDISQLLENDPLIAIVYSERSDGKSFQGMKIILDDYLERGFRGIWLRRLPESFKKPKIRNQFDAVITEGALIGYPWDGIEFRLGGYYLYRYDDELDKKIYDDKPFCYAEGVSLGEAHKGGDYENVHYVVFDEFLSRDGAYLNDEPVLFAQVMSSILRYWDKARFILLGNTVNPDSPYFDEFGINVHEIEQGTIKTFECEDEMGEKAYLNVEYVAHNPKGKKSDKFFKFFKSTRVKMITDGTWEMADYPRLPIERIKPKDIKFEFYILKGSQCVKGQYIRVDKGYFIYFSQCEEAIDEDKDIIFSTYLDYRRNWFQNIFMTKYDFLINTLKLNKIYYDSNETGEIVRRYLIYCNSYSIIKA